MSTDFPDALDNFTNPNPNSLLSTPGVVHSEQHANTNDAIEALEAKVGIDGSADTASLDYLMTQLYTPAVLLALIKAVGAIYASGITYVSGTGTAGVDNTAQVVKSVTLPANTLTQVGDRMRVRVYWTGDNGVPVTSTTTVNGVTVSHTTDGGAATLQINECYVHYIDDTHANIIETELGALGAASGVNIAGFDWDADQAIAVSQDKITGNHIIVYALFVDIFPKGI